MAFKKRASKKTAAKKKVAVKPAKAKVVASEPEPASATLKAVADVFAVREGDNAVVHLTLDPSVQDVTVTVNGRTMFRGRP